MGKYVDLKSFDFKITDVNAKIGCRDSYGKLVDIDELLRIMDFYNIDHAVCSDGRCYANPKGANIHMKDVAEKTGGRVGVCAYLDCSLGADNLPGEGSLTERLMQFHAEAVRIQIIPERSTFSVFYWEEILEAVNAAKLPMIIDGEYTDAFMLALPDAAIKYPDIKFVLVQHGCCRGRQNMPLLKKLNNVYLTMENMLDNLQIEEITDAGCVDKLLFATCYPDRVPAGALGLALFAGISDADKRKILSENWEGIKG